MKMPAIARLSNKIPAFARVGSAALLSGLAQQGFSLLHFLLAVRWLSPEALGTWAMYLTLTSLVEMARLGLVQNALTHFTAHYPEVVPALRTAALWIGFSLSVGGAVVLWLLVVALGDVWQLPGLAGLLIWYPLLAAITSLVRLQDGVAMTMQNFKIGLVSAVAYGLIFAIGMVAIHYFLGEMPLSWLVFLQIPALGSAFLVARLVGGKTLRFVLPEVFWVKKLWAFGRFGMLSNLGSMLMQRVDLLLLGAWVLPGQLAVYNVATRLVGYLDFPLNALGLTFAPKIARAHCEGGIPKVKILYEKSVALLLLITLPMGLAVVLGAGWLVQSIAGPAYQDAVLLVQVLVVASVVKPWGRMFGVTLEAIGLPAWNFRMLLVSCLINGGLNLLLIPVWGIFGAAMATGLSLIITVSVGHFWLRRALPVRPLAPIYAIWTLASSLGKKGLF